MSALTTSAKCGTPDLSTTWAVIRGVGTDFEISSLIPEFDSLVEARLSHSLLTTFGLYKSFIYI